MHARVIKIQLLLALRMGNKGRICYFQTCLYDNREDDLIKLGNPDTLVDDGELEAAPLRANVGCVANFSTSGVDIGQAREL